jgi:hypothetical protein
MLREIDLGRALVAIGSLAVLVALFLDWFEVGGTGWEVFETLDLVLAALAIAGIFAATRPPEQASALRLAPLAMLLIVVVQLLALPPAAAGDPEAGAWTALGGAVLASIGTVLMLAQISVRIDVAERPAGPRRRRTGTTGENPAVAPPEPHAPAASRGLFDREPEPEPQARRTPETRASEPEAPVRPEPREVPAVDRRRQAAEPDDLERTQPLTPPDPMR